MATFISTIKFTQQGIAGIDESTKRATAFKAAAKKLADPAGAAPPEGWSGRF